MYHKRAKPYFIWIFVMFFSINVIQIFFSRGKIYTRLNLYKKQNIKGEKL